MKDKHVIIAKYYSDIGSIKIGNREFNINIHNGYGDGEHEVIIVKHRITLDEPELHELRNNYTFVTTMEGRDFNIYNYDNLKRDELDNPNNIIATLSGKYSIYTNYGNILIENWRN